LAIKLFGFELVRDKEQVDVETQTPITPVADDGSVSIATTGSYGFFVDIDGSYRSEIDLVTKYRTMAIQPELESAIDDITNEAVVHDKQSKTVSIILDDLEQKETIKDKIRDEFQNILKLLNFGNDGADIFRKWYIDGRMYYHVVIDKDNPRDGIQKLIYIDPRRIRKIRNVVKKKDEDGRDIVDRIDEFYIYNDKNLTKIDNGNIPQLVGPSAGAITFAKDSIAYITSGLTDPSKQVVLSYLHKAIRPLNQLRFVEDAIVIYRLSRAPERRVFYVDVGKMPRIKAEQYLQNMMMKFRNKLVYDPTTGDVRDDRRFQSILEDFWIPRLGDKNTEITTLPAGQNLGELEDVKYFQNKLYKALSVPISRIEPTTGFSLGRSTEITRDELKFMKFINKLRDRFSILFDDLMSKQLSLKGICSLEEWEEFKQDIHYDFLKDNNFYELKEAELLQNRLAILVQVDPYIGRFFSKKWVQENVLHMDEDEIEQMQEEMDKEFEENPQPMMPPGMPGQIPQDPNAPGQDPTQGPPPPAQDPTQDPNAMMQQGMDSQQQVDQPLDDINIKAQQELFSGRK
jgi:hypothetical protein